VAVLCLVATAFTAPLLARPAAGYGEHVFEANPVAGAGDPTYSVYAGATLAQSFRVDTTYLIKDATLRVQNDGSSVNPLVVSIHPDDPTRHVPVMSVQLASTSQVTPNNAAGPANWTFPFNPSAVLSAGATYWIVAENAAPQAPPSNGYAWVESNADSYPDGSAYLLDPSTGVWTGLPYDLWFSTYGQEWAANVTVGVTTNRTQAQPGDTITFSVQLNNTGYQAAPTVWINDTLQAGLVNPSLGFPNLAPVSAASFPNLTFRNVANGAHFFTITVEIAYGTPPGTVLTNDAALAFENSTGAVLEPGRASASVLVGLATKQLYLGGTSVTTKLLTTSRPTLSGLTTSSLNAGAAQPLDFLLSPALARPFRTTNVTALLWISIVKPPPQTLRLNVSLLDNTSVVASLYPTVTMSAAGYQFLTFKLPGFDHTFPVGHRIRLQIWSFGGGGGSTDTLILSYNSTANPSRLDLTTTTYVSVDQFVLGNQVTNATTWSPLDSLVTWANVSDPFGSNRIAGAWVNITSPSNQRVASGAMTVVATDSSSLPAWKLFRYTLNPPLATGRYRVDVKAVEDNGVVSPAEAFADVAVPSFSLQNIANVTRARVGDTFAYSVYFNNSGTGLAGKVWINDTLPSELTYVTSDLAYSSVSGTTYTWILSNVTIGGHRLEIDVNVPGTSTAASWVQTHASLAYTDASGHPLPDLASNSSVFLNGPQIGLTVSSVPSSAVHSNESVTYTIGMQNAGDAAAQIWVNDTLPASFGYDTDTAGTLGGATSVVGSEVRFHFSNMPAATTWSFQLVARAGPALIRNASNVDTVTLNYTSLSGYLMPPGFRTAATVTASPWIAQGDITFLVNRTGPGETVPAVIRFSNLGNEPASKAWINLTLDARIALVNASAAFTGSGTSIGFARSAVAVGVTTIYLNLTVNDSAPDRTVLQVLGTVEYADGIGNLLPFVILSPGSVTVNAAVLSLSVTPPAPLMEAGISFPLAVSLTNGGSGSTGDVWLNVTLPATLTYYDDTSGASYSVVGSAYTWHWPNQLPGLFAFNLYLKPREATPNGTVADLDFHVDYMDFDLRPRPGLDSPVHAVVVAPSIALTVLADRSGVQAGGKVTYTLRVHNQGLTLAEQVQVTDDVDLRLQILTYNSSIAATGTQELRWTFTDLAPGSTETINLTVRVADGLQAGTPIPMALEANYTNSVGIYLTHIRSFPMIITVDFDLMPLVWIALGGAVAGAFVFVLLSRRKKVEIEEVFLVYRDGVLISHLSRTLMREKDEDVLSGMLTAVQEFVREAFQYGEHRELHKLDFGEYRILIERGKYVYLAVVYSGEESPQIRKKVRTVIERIEDQFGRVLEKWDGDMEEVIGARDLIRDTLLGSANHNHNNEAEPPTHGK